MNSPPLLHMSLAYKQYLHSVQEKRMKCTAELQNIARISMRGAVC